MSLFDIHALIYRLKMSPALQQRFREAPWDVLVEFELTPGEGDALAAGDIQALWRLGVHPMLLLPFSRMVGLSADSYRQLLTLLSGTRTLTSDC
jgi:hypothetical protein